MNNPKISVIVPVYNVEQYLPRCIDSILAQTFTDFELLLIDDGSRDASGRICDEYAEHDARIRVFHQENKGVSVARNLGLDNARGEWIAFVDSDDCVSTEWLHHYAANLDADIVFQGAKVVEAEGIPTSEIKLHDNRAERERMSAEIAYLERKSSILNATWSKIFKRRIIDDNNIRFDPVCKLSEDLIFTIQYLSHSNSIRTLSELGYNYLRVNSYLTRVRYDFMTLFEMKKRVMNAVEKYCNSNLDDEAYKTIAQNEFGYTSFFLALNPPSQRTDRFLAYDWLRKMKPYVNVEEMKLSRCVFHFVGIRNVVFDPLLLFYSFTFNRIYSVLKFLKIK